MEQDEKTLRLRNADIHTAAETLEETPCFGEKIVVTVIDK